MQFLLPVSPRREQAAGQCLQLWAVPQPRAKGTILPPLPSPVPLLCQSHQHQCAAQKICRCWPIGWSFTPSAAKAHKPSCTDEMTCNQVFQVCTSPALPV